MYFQQIQQFYKETAHHAHDALCCLVFDSSIFFYFPLSTSSTFLHSSMVCSWSCWPLNQKKDRRDEADEEIQERLEKRCSCNNQPLAQRWLSSCRGYLEDRLQYPPNRAKDQGGQHLLRGHSTVLTWVTGEPSTRNSSLSTDLLRGTQVCLLTLYEELKSVYWPSTRNSSLSTDLLRGTQVCLLTFYEELKSVYWPSTRNSSVYWPSTRNSSLSADLLRGTQACLLTFYEELKSVYWPSKWNSSLSIDPLRGTQVCLLTFCEELKSVYWPSPRNSNLSIDLLRGTQVCLLTIYEERDPKHTRD